MPTRALLALVAFLLAASGRASPHPVVQLRRATIQTGRQGGQGGSSTSAAAPRRSTLEVAHHTRSEQWGQLRGASQLIVTHRHDLGHAEKAALVQQLRARGLEAAGHIPDSSLLVVGPGSLAEEVQSWPGVLWVGNYEPSYKVAPEWDELLQQLAALAVNTTAWGAQSSEARQRVAAALLGLPVLVEFGGAGGQPRLGVQVGMPRCHGAAGSSGSSSNSSAGQQNGRVSRRQQQQGEQVEQHAGEAASADWAGPLSALCEGGVEVRPAGSSTALVLAPPRCLEAVLDWLSQRPAVHWLAPAPRLRLRNYQASVITQSAQAPPSWSTSVATDPAFHPIWAAGITGTGQIVGCGDSGVDRRHCFFRDPAVDDAKWRTMVRYQDGVKTFDCESCRKIRYYRAFGDESDSNGHGTHVAGTLVGFPYSASSITSPGTQYMGMAPTARLAFIDLGDGTSDSIYTPADLAGGYFDYTYAVGARVHSDSWGSASINYDFLSAQVDEYCWTHPDFLPVFAAGNEGDQYSSGSQEVGVTTVTSPATAKNCIAAGATQTSGESLSSGSTKYVTYDATVTEGSSFQTTFRVLQADFGPSISTLGSSTYALVTASPLLACAPLQNADEVKGKMVLIQRGSCNFVQKAAFAQAAGAAAALIYDNVMGAYFVLGTDGSIRITIPTMSITRRLGQQLYDALYIGKSVTISFAPSTTPQNAFENLASYSSQGPTRDNRIKPDLVAPGTVRSSKALTLGGGDCDTMLMAGTSMATPVIAGSAILVRQYFTDGYYPTGQKIAADAFTPSSALIKAVMISGASSIQGVEADTGLPIDPPPSFRQGFGRVNLGQSLHLAGDTVALQVADKVPINTGESHEYCVRAKGGAVSITLVWTDYPGSPAARKALVNDLDLTVRAEGYNGMPLLGNGGSISDSSSPDRENNVEQVALVDLPEGRVSIEVKGYSVYTPGGPQPYALVVTGAFQGNLTRLGGDEAGGCSIVVAVIKSGPAGVTNQPVTFDFGTQSGNNAGVTFECQLTDPLGNVTAAGMHPWQDCTSPQAYPGLADGPYQFSVRAKGEKIASSQAFIRDTTPPAVAFGSTPPDSTPNATAVLAFSATDSSPVTFSCQLEASGASGLQRAVYAGTVNSSPLNLTVPYNCTSPQTFHWLLPAGWKFTVVGTDAAGNAAPAQVREWAVAFEAGKQYTRLYSGLFGLVPGVSADFEFGVLQMSGGSVGQVAGAATVCWLETVAVGSESSPDWKDCSSPASFGKLDDGLYRFHARAAAAASSPDTDAVTEFRLDSIPPITSISSRVSPIYTTSSVALQFQSDEEGSTYMCRLANRDDPSAGSPSWEACASPKQYSNLTDGQYDFSVYATDLVGNQGEPANASFVVDTTPPQFTSINYPVATNQPDITITFEANDGLRGGVANVTCRFRPLALVSTRVSAIQSEWNPCTSPLEFTNLEEGHYGLTLRATDVAGLVNQTNELDIWVDFTPPVITISGPASGSVVGSTVTFDLAENSTLPAGTASNISTYQVFLQSISQDQANGIDNGTITALVPGVTSTPGTKLQSASREDRGPASGSTAAAAAQQQHLLADSADGGTTLDAGCVGTWCNGTSPLTYTGLGSGYYALQARGIDLAGNIGNYTLSEPFQVEASSGSSTSNLVWIIVGVAGGVALIVVVVLLLLWRCRRRPAAAAAAVQHPTNGYHHGTNGYANGSAYTGTAGAWGYTNGYANGYGGAPAPAPAVDTDALYQQQLAYALAASQRDTTRTPLPAANDDELSRAIQASLQEQQQHGGGAATPNPVHQPAVVYPAAYPSAPPAEDGDDDPELRAAIQASLAEQQRYSDVSPWRGL